jgi:hypothetical protein
MTPNELLVRAAHLRRKELLNQVSWLDTAGVSVRQGGGESQAESEAIVRALRHANALFGVWSGSEYLHPVFQFDPQTGSLRPQMREMLEVLPQKFTEWQKCYWFFQTNEGLNGACPADVFLTDPQTVLQLARRSFTGRVLAA